MKEEEKWDLFLGYPGKIVSMNIRRWMRVEPVEQGGMKINHLNGNDI